VNQLANRLRAVGNDPERANFTARFCNRDGNGFRMDIQKRIVFYSLDRLSFRLWFCTARAQGNPRSAKWRSVILFSKEAWPTGCKTRSAILTR
jgi:hypothetical protein